MKIRVIILILLFVITRLLGPSLLFAKEYSLFSPNKKTEIRVQVDNKLRYAVVHGNQPVIAPSPISLTLENQIILGLQPVVTQVQRQAIRDTLKPVIRLKSSRILNQYNELRLSFKQNFDVIFRAYNDGVAYRFATKETTPITIYAEEATFEFLNDHSIYFPEEDSFFSHSERIYRHIRLSEIGPNRMSCLPAVVAIDNGLRIAILEADLEDYPGMYLTGMADSPTRLIGIFPNYPLAVEQKSDRDVPVTKRADYLARTSGTRSFPWRALIIAERDADLVESQLVYKLAAASRIGDTGWIKPGKVAWDWWNWNNVYGVAFRAGINTETYKYYIDFASRHRIEYVILDEGWYKLGNLLDVVPEINIPELVQYARERQVGIILWVIWKTLDDQLQPALDQFAAWGVAGIKVDFMQRDDQWMVNYYYKIAQEAAKRHLLVDFHGAYKPTGLMRTFPNVLTSEGVRGLEWSKWSADDPNPGHNLTLPFTRMLAGPMDYTPGAMINATKEQFRPVFNRPMSQGTRCHQLAMYVVFESPLEMLCDSPSNYEREPECLEFLSAVPTVWDDTKVLDAKIAEYILIARKSGNRWYLGAMTNWSARDLTVDFSFLDDKTYHLQSYQDGINADRNAMDYRKSQLRISRNDRLTIHLAPGGGWVGIVE
ncbi:MAG: glycoside hydrolase family 97 protein [candidate division KSB1 bacterium]|nr:glycoside hydrolase family 97 protein [candidate division KSB1 bacterium]MDZ7340155.1 glycoside hydrolase family 97 protein [candidate division KSB1 bacterium]